MLKTPAALTAANRNDDPVLAIIAGERGMGVRIIEEGVVEIGHFSLDFLVWGRNAPEWYMGYPELVNTEEEYLGSYGVCDTPQQFLEKFRERLSKDPREFVVGFTHIPKDPSNKGQGGGWRWHKWGPYIGTGDPQCEYLDDEDGFENGVYVYHVLQTGGPNLNKIR